MSGDFLWNNIFITWNGCWELLSTEVWWMPGKLSEMLLVKYVGKPVAVAVGGNARGDSSADQYKWILWIASAAFGAWSGKKKHISEEMSWTEHRSSIFLGHVVPESWLFLPSTLHQRLQNSIYVISFETCSLSWEILDFWRQNHAKLSFLWNSRAPKQCFVAWNLGLIWLVKISWPSTFICLKCEIPPFPAISK